MVVRYDVTQGHYLVNLRKVNPSQVSGFQVEGDGHETSPNFPQYLFRRD